MIFLSSALGASVRGEVAYLWHKRYLPLAAQRLGLFSPLLLDPYQGRSRHPAHTLLDSFHAISTCALHAVVKLKQQQTHAQDGPRISLTQGPKSLQRLTPQQKGPRQIYPVELDFADADDDGYQTRTRLVPLRKETEVSVYQRPGDDLRTLLDQTLSDEGGGGNGESSTATAKGPRSRLATRTSRAPRTPKSRITLHRNPQRGGFTLTKEVRGANPGIRGRSSNDGSTPADRALLELYSAAQKERKAQALVRRHARDITLASLSGHTWLRNAKHITASPCEIEVSFADRAGAIHAGTWRAKAHPNQGGIDITNSTPKVTTPQVTTPKITTSKFATSKFVSPNAAKPTRASSMMIVAPSSAAPDAPKRSASMANANASDAAGANPSALASSIARSLYRSLAEYASSLPQETRTTEPAALRRRSATLLADYATPPDAPPDLPRFVDAVGTPLVLVCPPGAGSSSFFAHAAARALRKPEPQRARPDPGESSLADNVIVHYVADQCPGGGSIATMTHYVATALRETFDLEETIPLVPETAVLSSLRRILLLASTACKTKIFILIDGLDPVLVHSTLAEALDANGDDDDNDDTIRDNPTTISAGSEYVFVCIYISHTFLQLY